MKTYGGVEVLFHTFLTYGDEWSLTAFPMGKEPLCIFCIVLLEAVCAESVWMRYHREKYLLLLRIAHDNDLRKK
jgi:hypothetical protein